MRDLYAETQILHIPESGDCAKLKSGYPIRWEKFCGFDGLHNDAGCVFKISLRVERRRRGRKQLTVKPWVGSSASNKVPDGAA